jgi:2-deoxy-D-gluconate 3-dehydrogenase
MAVDYSCFGLQDRAAVVAGASQGIRRAIALGVAQAGEHVILANTRKAVTKRSAR